MVAQSGAGGDDSRIRAVRPAVPPSSWFNAATTEAGRDALGWYHERKDEARSIGLGPEHDWSSHAADAFGLMAVGQVNNSARQNMADLRAAFNDLIWFQYGVGDRAVAPAYASGTSFTLAGFDATPVWHAGRRVKAVGSSTGTIFGTIASAAYASSTTTVTVNWDSGALANESLTLYLSQIPVLGNPTPPAGITGF